MAVSKTESQKVVEDVSVQRRPVFNQPGGAKRFIYVVSLTTLKGNSGHFEVAEDTYNDDDRFAQWLADAIANLDRASNMTGV